MTINLSEPAVKHSDEIGGRRPSRRRWAAIGFLSVCLPIGSLGVYGLYVDACHADRFPPDEPRCGNGAMAAMFFIFPIAPVLGLIGAAVGYGSATAICEELDEKSTEATGASE